jgi:hypothetical protein
MVHRAERFGRPSRERETSFGIHGVVDGGRVVRRTMDQIGAVRPEHLIRQRRTPEGVRQNDAGVGSGEGNELADQIVAFLGGEVEADRSLAAVRASPVDALSSRGQCPTTDIRTATRRVNADHIGTDLT